MKNPITYYSGQGMFWARFGSCGKGIMIKNLKFHSWLFFERGQKNAIRVGRYLIKYLPKYQMTSPRRPI